MIRRIDRGIGITLPELTWELFVAARSREDHHGSLLAINRPDRAGAIARKEARLSGDSRPRLHLTPPANWMNDPNGLRVDRGALHVTYQYNPDEPRWGRMHWGHAVTSDLVSWTHLPIAVSPGSGSDEFGCWSGSLVGDAGGASLFYTGVRLDGQLRRQSICRAVNMDDDLIAWRKDEGNPVVPAPPPDIEPDLFRDPFVWRDGERWSMLVGAGTVAGQGTVLLYRSPDLRAWSYVGRILTADQFDPAQGVDAPIWECPQLLRLDGVDILVVSVVDRAPGIRPSHVMAFVGRLADDVFDVASLQQLGMGPDFYAPAATMLPDGRWLLFGWIPEDPPGEGSSRTWAGSLTLPRIVSINQDGLSLALADEVLRCRETRRPHRPVEVTEADSWRRRLPAGPVELGVVIEPVDADEVVVELRDAEHGDSIARAGYRQGDRVLSLARAGIVGVAGRNSVTATTLPAGDGPTVRLRLILDGSILEMETNGHIMATARLPERASHEPLYVVIASHGGRCRLRQVDIWPLDVPPGGWSAGPQ
jgi:beta-fructofuranosidase